MTFGREFSKSKSCNVKKKFCAKLAAMRLVRNQNFAHGKSSANLAKAASSKNLKLQNTNILRC